MFDLDQAIEEWRQQMLATGIRAPVPLDELESHLRDDVEQQVHSGQSVQQAVATAIQRLGPSTQLKSEFEMARSNLHNPSEPMKHKLINILVSIAVMFIAIGLIMPALAKLREQGVLGRFEITMLLIGTTALTSSSMFGAYSIFKRSKA